MRLAAENWLSTIWLPLLTTKQGGREEEEDGEQGVVKVCTSPTTSSHLTQRTQRGRKGKHDEGTLPLPSPLFTLQVIIIIHNDPLLSSPSRYLLSTIRPRGDSYIPAYTCMHLHNIPLLTYTTLSASPTLQTSTHRTSRMRSTQGITRTHATHAERSAARTQHVACHINQSHYSLTHTTILAHLISFFGPSNLLTQAAE